MVWSRRVILLVVLLLGVFFGITGCNGIYILKMGAGQARIIQNAKMYEKKVKK